MQSKRPSLSVSVKLSHSSRWNKEHFKASLLLFALFLLFVGRFLFSIAKPQHPDVISSLETPSNSSNMPLMASTHMSPKLSDAVFFGPSDFFDLPFFDGGSMTAIFPVTDSSLEQLYQTLGPLISDDSSVSAITIVCPSHALPALHAKLFEGHMDTFMDISVAIWPEGLDEGAAVLNAAAHMSTEYVLVIGSEGLANLHLDSREHLLSHPLLLDVPTGFCGGKLSTSGKQVVCAIPSSESQPTSFLFPPFVIPSSLIRGFNATAESVGTNFWMNLGAALIETSGSESVVRESASDSDRDWCKAQCQKYDVIDDSTLSQCSTSSSLDETFQQTRDPSLSSSLAIILRRLEDLQDFSSVACRFSQNGYNTHILILSHENDHITSHDGSFPWLHDHLISSVCNVSYSALHSSSNEFANAEAVSFWLESANETVSAIIYGAGSMGDASEYPFVAALAKQTAMGVTVIQIPQSDIPYCDWIGSLSLVELRNWHAPSIEISVITDNRPSSLRRLFKSLNTARYFGDSVPIRINVEQTADLETRRLIDEFHWNHGAVFVHHRVVHAGLLTAIVESWFPRSNNSYGVLLEDDVEVSLLFYAWIKMTLLRYRYGALSNRNPSLFGISLYQQKHIELRPEGRRPFDAKALFDTYGILYRDTPYLSQIPCSWGAVYFPEHWREFHTYLMVRFSEAWLPLRASVVPHVRSNRWAKSWKKFFIELVFLRGYVMLYPNYDDFVSLSTNHLEVGSHVKEQPRSVYEQKKALFTLPLMTLPENLSGSGELQATGLLDLPEEQLPSWSDLPILDLLGRLSSETEVEDRGMERQKRLVGCSTIGSQDERRRPFEAEDLFTCNASEDEVDETEDGLDSRDSL